MDHSIYGYLSRRSIEELRLIITFCQSQSDREYYGEIEKMAQEIIQSKTGNRA